MSSMPPGIPFSPSSLFAAVFQVSGMTCDHDVRAFTSQVSEIQGITSVYVSLSTGALAVAGLQRIDNAAVAAAVQAAGHPLTRPSGSRPVDELSLRADTIPARIDRFLTTQLKDSAIPGAAIGVTRGDRVLMVRGHGHDSTPAPVTGHALFQIASLSKSFTALAVMQLVDAGRLRLDDPVQQHLPEFQMADPRAGQITVRELLDHTSGITDAVVPDLSRRQPSNPREATTSLRSTRLASTPGTSYSYANPGYQVAARLVEVLSGEPFDRYLPADGTRIVSRRVMRLLHTPSAPRSGNAWGWGTHVPARAPTRLEHSGNLFTFTSEQALWPGSGYGVVLLFNSGSPMMLDQITIVHGVFDIVEGTAPPANGPHLAARIDTVLGLLTLAVLALCACGVVRAGRWAARRNRTPVRAALGLLPAVIVRAAGVVFPRLAEAWIARDVTWKAAAYEWPAANDAPPEAARTDRSTAIAAL